jgi:hypothetical protein
MLDPWIIEEIRRREDERRRDRDKFGRLDLPLESPHQREREKPSPPAEEEGERGVVIIDM